MNVIEEQTSEGVFLGKRFCLGKALLINKTHDVAIHLNIGCSASICHGDRYLADLFKNNHIGQLQEVIVAPDIELALIYDVGNDISLHCVHIGF